VKNFVEAVYEWKNAAAMMFSASIVLYIVVTLFLGESFVPVSAIISLLVVSGIGTFLQFFAFSGRIIKKMRYSARIFVFAVPFLALLLVSAFLFNWVPVGEALPWLMFIGIYLIVLVGGTIAYEIYYHAMGKKYDGLLGQYRKQRDGTI